MDLEATGAAIGEAFSQADGASGTVSAAAVVTEKQPEITTEELSSIKDVLGTFSTSFKTSGASRSTNLQVGAAKINGQMCIRDRVEGAMEDVVDYINREAAKAMGAGKRVGIICTRESRDLYPQGLLEVIGSRSQEETVAHNLFAVLRDFDDRQVDCIFSESFSEDQLGQAIMNRLCKAAGYHIVKCGGPSEE